MAFVPCVRRSSSMVASAPQNPWKWVSQLSPRTTGIMAEANFLSTTGFFPVFTASTQVEMMSVPR